MKPRTFAKVKTVHDAAKDESAPASIRALAIFHFRV